MTPTYLVSPPFCVSAEKFSIITFSIFLSISVFFIIKFETGLYKITDNIIATSTATRPTASFTNPFL